MGGLCPWDRWTLPSHLCIWFLNHGSSRGSSRGSLERALPIGFSKGARQHMWYSREGYFVYFVLKAIFHDFSGINHVFFQSDFGSPTLKRAVQYTPHSLHKTGCHTISHTRWTIASPMTLPFSVLISKLLQ